MRVAADLPDPAPAVPDGVGLAAYRIVQEALTNVRKHAGPDATVDLRVAVHRGVAIDVRDDGRGFEPDRVRRQDGRGTGLAGIRGRADDLGGRTTVESAPGEGTTVSVVFPRGGVGS